MPENASYFEWKGYAVACTSFFLSLFLFYKNTLDLFYSIFGAFLLAGLVWGSYLIIRMILLVYRSK